MHVNWKTKLEFNKVWSAKLVFSNIQRLKDTGKTQNVNTEKTLLKILAESLKSIYE